ncbi:universal stress protein [Streptomyces sp. DH24]|uniref:universal stress protein n=1 Tax=Streptomyces sp. DH24 TaxID=3040123 RepID=UPI0024418933|nr:universal stress protein [Streptomyces sp. DH24]MDG9717944.1 universal stress protein [Streptomyces sp. DH24]
MTGAITAGVDGTAESLAALDWAAREAVRRGLALRIVHAWRFQQYDTIGSVDRESQGQGARALADEAARTVAERHPGLDVSTAVPEGGIADTLARAAADSEMLALGSRGHGPVVGFLLGSVGRQVVAETDVPVVLVRAGDRASTEAAGREIVVGQQGGPDDSHAVLRFAFETAAVRSATVRVVRAWTLPPLFAYSPSSLKLLDEAGGLEPYEKSALAEAVRPWRERFPDVPVVEHVEMGSAGQVLLSVAGTAQLMVVGRRAHRTAVGARVGSVTHGMLHHAECPVAVVPHTS